MAALGSKKEVDLQQLLPYLPDDGKKLTFQTAKVLERLIEQKELPPQVIVSMGKYFDEMEQLLD